MPDDDDDCNDTELIFCKRCQEEYEIPDTVGTWRCPICNSTDLDVV